MIKKLLFSVLLTVTSMSYAQHQTVNGNLTVGGDIQLTTGTQTPYGELGKKINFGYVNENADHIYISRMNIRSDHSELRLNLGDDGSEKLAIGITHYKDKSWKESIVFQANGRIGIGVSDPSCALDINGTIRSKEVKIEATGWSDFVFDKNYELPTLQSVEQHINDNGHLPDIPSEKEVIENGVNVVEMQAKLLQKIEELTLYIIDQDKKIKELERKLEDNE